MGFSKTNHRPVRRLGQNFLIDQSIAQEIISSISPNTTDVVLEPGPGHGSLTRILVREAGRVVAVEKDPILVAELREEFNGLANLTILEGDVLKMGDSLPSFNKLVSTPPYYISSKLTLLLASRRFDTASIVFQKEFGARLLAKPGTADYGRLTVMAGRKLEVEKVRDISKRAFRPMPKVDSVLLKFRPKAGVSEIDEVLFEEVVRGLFTQRRRLVKSALSHYLGLKFGRETGRMMLARMTLPDLRVFQLSIEQLENLSLQLWRLVSDRIVSSGVDKSGQQ